MQQELSQLQAQIAALQAENESLKLEKHQLQEENQELKEQNHQLQYELNNVVVAAAPDYEAVRDRILSTMTTGKGSFSRTSPQFRAASRALDRFVEAITSIQTSTPTPLINQNSN